MKIMYYTGDITKSARDAIVNAANPLLVGGGGVDGAIHRAAGPELFTECMTAEKQNGIRCPAGTAVITTGCNLRAKYVIHAVGPIYPGGIEPRYPGEARCSTVVGANELLAKAIRACLSMAECMRIRSIAFPAISCGVYGCTIEAFAKVMQATLEEKRWDLDNLDIVLFTTEDYSRFDKAWLEGCKPVVP